MHDSENGTITAIAISFDHNYLFTAGSDGNLFSYKWNGFKEGATYPTIRHTITPFEGIPEEELDSEMLSFEQIRRKHNDDQRHTICDANKNRVLESLAKLKETFGQVWSRNVALPQSQRILDGCFELDERITRDLQESVERKLKLAQRKMTYDVEKAKISVSKLKRHLVDPLDTFPITVLGLR